MTGRQVGGKRAFDIIFSVMGLILFSWLIFLAFALASIDTKKNGFFAQRRVGKDGRLFKIIKIRTMRDVEGVNTTVTTGNDPRITPLGAFFRRTKIDELPQLTNVLLGQMSFVGPRPDVPGYYDQLPEKEREILLSVRPGITGPATLKYRAEEEMLAAVDEPETFNREVIFPNKVSINLDYVHNYSFAKDLRYIWATVFGTNYM